MFDLVSGFLQSQVLQALVEFEVLEWLSDGPRTAEDLGRAVQVPERRMEVMLRGGVAVGLLRARGDMFDLTTRGAALLGVPGLTEMIRHHNVLYRDLADPVAFFRGETDPELAHFWPYVFGGDVNPRVAERYSDLMADSQALVAEETLRSVSLRGVRRLMDVGGGNGAFLAAVAAAYPDMRACLFDLPQVAPAADARFREAGVSDRLDIVPGNFRKDDLPQGADAISLVRVLYDHADETVDRLLRCCFEALPPGGRLIVSEPMTGGGHPTRAGDVYFALYTMAMGTGRARSPEEISEVLRRTGYAQVAHIPTFRPFVTSVVTAVRSS